MNSVKNPILNFRFPADEQALSDQSVYNLISGEHNSTGNSEPDGYNTRNMRTMITLTREAADSTESAG
jgi:hypothetical protein